MKKNRNTRQRGVSLDILRETALHPTAEMIYRDARYAVCRESVREKEDAVALANRQPVTDYRSRVTPSHLRLNPCFRMNAPKSARSGTAYCRALSSDQP